MASAAADLERRKQLRLRLRPDVVIEAQKYEGRTYYVLKDPVSLRYYRIKEYERFLLTLFDGRHTLEDAQKAYEREYRPDRLRLEDLEAFAQQLLLAGLVLNESPKAGAQLFERRKKRKRTELLQTVTNILYVKVPLFDPDRVLTAMLRYTRWIFTRWFFALSILLMLSAVMLVATNFQVFLSKLPDYHEFFNIKTLVYLWAALAVVKVIHEFGHGLSCKAFGGEVHEMGLLFLCLSPAMYCNVSDAWKMPNKWHRIIISFAGIYVELVIAAIATWVWWNNPASPFINHMALSVMVVCSVSTFVFNANPLMRFDGYYVLADWIEIPNLRERSNRYLSNTVQTYCLGIEVPPEPYMALRRKILFITYAVVSYIYRWVVTFGILLFLYHFLRPYKLEILSNLLTLMAIGSMVGWPAYRLIKGMSDRGWRFPEMKRWRVTISTTVVVLLALVFFFVPLPINRILSTGLVRSTAEGVETVRLHKDGSTLERLLVKDGEQVAEGQELAIFSNLQLDAELTRARLQQKQEESYLDYLKRQKDIASDRPRLNDLQKEIGDTEGRISEARNQARELERIKEDELTLRAPCAGVVAGMLRPTNIGRSYPIDAQVCTILRPGRLTVCLPVEPSEWNQLKEQIQPLTAAASAARNSLDKRLKVEYRGMHLSDALHDVVKQAGLNLEIDPEARISDAVLREPVTLEAKNQRASTILDRLLTPVGLGYIVRSRAGDPHDGWLVLRPGQERGTAFHPAMLDLPVYLRVQGRDSKIFHGRLLPLPETEKEPLPPALTNKLGGPIPVKAAMGPDNKPVPQTQYYLVYIDMLDPDAAVLPGNLVVAKIYCKPMTCGSWLWRKVNGLFDLSLW
jgi:putative peptide zinc metalloprotease protein